MKRWAPLVLIALLALAFWMVDREAERRGLLKGRTEAALRHEAELAQLIQQRDSAYAFKRETLKVVIPKWATIRLTDTIPVPVHVPGKPDTVEIYVPRAAADTAVQMCLRTLNSCDASLRARDSLVLALRGHVKLLEGSKPSKLAGIRDRALWGLIGFAVGAVVAK